jgi:N-acylglucosamine 2-epimerase
MLEAFAKRCRRELDKSVIPFWLKHSPDRKFGGYFTCLERDGAVFDDKKYMWMQGREVWMFSRLYNQWAQKDEYLDMGRLGADFLTRFGRDAKGRVYFSLTRDGRPVAYQRKPYGATFVMLGLLEYGIATGDANPRRRA